MSWLMVGLLFGLGFMVAAMLAVSGTIILAACVSALKGEEEKEPAGIGRWEGTD